MSMQVLNSTENIGIAHAVSAWFQPAWTGYFFELGDLEASGVTLNPEFVEHMSVRTGIRASAKKILTKRSASINLKLNEPNILNLQRILYGGEIKLPGDVDSLDTITVYDGRLMQLSIDFEANNKTLIDFNTVSEGVQCAFTAITVTAVYKLTDAAFTTNLLEDDSPKAVSGAGVCELGTDAEFLTTAGCVDGEIVYVKYQFDLDNMFSTQIFGASNANIAGEAQLQVRNTNGGVVQIWNFASVQLSPNGEIGFPTDAVQSIPITMTLFERAGTFGRVYTK